MVRTPLAYPPQPTPCQIIRTVTPNEILGHNRFTYAGLLGSPGRNYICYRPYGSRLWTAFFEKTITMAALAPSPDVGGVPTTPEEWWAKNWVWVLLAVLGPLLLILAIVVLYCWMVSNESRSAVELRAAEKNDALWMDPNTEPSPAPDGPTKLAATSEDMALTSVIDPEDAAHAAGLPGAVPGDPETDAIVGWHELTLSQGPKNAWPDQNAPPEIPGAAPPADPVNWYPAGPEQTTVQYTPVQVWALPSSTSVPGGGGLCHKFCAKFLCATCSVFLRICPGMRLAVLLLACTMPKDLVNDN